MGFLANIFFHVENLFKHKETLLFFIPLILTIFPIIARFNIIPTRLQSFIEMIYEFLEDQFKVLFKTEAEYKKWMPFFLTIFFYILILNMTGLVPGLEPLTSNINLTASLAIMIFVITVFLGVKKNGPIKYLILLTPSGISPIVRGIMFPIEIISMFAKPFSLAVRLYANMFAGHIVIKTILGLTNIFHSFLIVPLDLAVVSLLLMFELFICLIQAFIFAYLSAIYISDSIYMSEHH